ncbi:MAG TPA: ribose-phosphate pyrophosphokinase [Gemmatimonadaceae bacterium]
MHRDTLPTETETARPSGGSAAVSASPPTLTTHAANAVLLAGTANPSLAARVERELGHRFGACAVQRFPDGEVMVRLDESVRGREVVLVQGTSPPVNDHLVELLVLADACRRAAAARIVAVLPYYGYARSDRRDGLRGPITGSLVARLMETAGIGQVVMLDVHTPALEGFFSVPVDNLTAVPVLADALRARLSPDTVVVAPDLGAVRLANRWAVRLHLDVAVCHKQRTSATEVSVTRITGDVAGRPCVVVDDMIATGSTIAESVRALRAAGARADIAVAATHAVLVPGALERIAACGVRDLLVTDSIPPREPPPAALRPDVVSIAPLLATAIQRLLDGGSLRELA